MFLAVLRYYTLMNCNEILIEEVSFSMGASHAKVFKIIKMRIYLL